MSPARIARRRPRRLAGTAALVAALCCVHVADSAAQSRSRGGAFTHIDVGARALGMGGAGTALERGAWAAYWNSANLFHLESKELAVDYADLFGLDIASHTEIAYAWRTEPKVNTVAEDGRIVEVPRDKDQLGWAVTMGVTRVDLDPEAYTEVTPGISAAGRPWGRVTIGGTFRLLSASSDLDDVSAFGFTTDLGLMLEATRSIAVGANVKNLLSTVSWSDKTSDTLPLHLTGAAAYTGLAPLVFAAEATTSTDNPLRDLRVGGEWSHRGLVAIRGGFIVHEDRFETDRTDLTFGAGVGLSGVVADYAFVGHNDTVGDTHRFSLSLRF